MVSFIFIITVNKIKHGGGWIILYEGKIIFAVFHRVNVQTNKLSQIFCGDFGKKFPWFIESPLASSGTSDKPRELYSRSPLKIPDLVDRIQKLTFICTHGSTVASDLTHKFSFSK